MHKLLPTVLTLALVSGCWGPKFTSIDDKSPTTSSTTGENTSSGGSGTDSSGTATSTTSVTAAGGSAGEPSAVSTTGTGGTVGGGAGEAGSSSDDSSTTGHAAGGSSTTAGSTEGSTGGPGCAPPTSVPELGEARGWESYEEPVSGLCSEEFVGTMRCTGEPCAEFTFAAEVEPWSEDGMVLRVTYKAGESQPFELIHDCGTEAYTCGYTLEREQDQVYFIELRKTASGFAVKAFYALGDDPASPNVTVLPTGDYQRPIDEECADGNSSANAHVADYWAEYVEWVNELTWEC